MEPRYSLEVLTCLHPRDRRINIKSIISFILDLLAFHQIRVFKIILDKKRLIRVYITVGEITLKYKREKKSPHISFISSTYDFQLRKKGVAQLQKKKGGKKAS